MHFGFFPCVLSVSPRHWPGTEVVAQRSWYQLILPGQQGRLILPNR